MRARRSTLKPLSAYWTAPEPVRVLTVPLVAAVILFVISMRLPWHHHIIPGSYTVIYGIQGANWLLVVAAVCALYAVRVWFLSPGTLARWLFSGVTFLLLIGMFADYVDAQDRAAQVQVVAFFGPGFFVALGATGLVVLSCVLLWRFQD